MTNYQDGELLSMVSTPDKEDVEWQAISYALKWAMGELVKHSYYIRTYCAIDELPEKILDAMAVALRTQYYDDSLDIVTKRKLVKNSLKWYSKAGTPSAVQELVETIFGSGKVTEWFENGGDPYTFEIETDTQITPEIVNELERMIMNVKNARSHLSKVSIKRSAAFSIYVGGKTSGNARAKITMGMSDGQGGSANDKAYEADVGLCLGIGSQVSKHYIINEAPQLSYSNSVTDRVGGAVAMNKKYIIEEETDGTV